MPNLDIQTPEIPKYDHGIRYNGCGENVRDVNVYGGCMRRILILWALFLFSCNDAPTNSERLDTTEVAKTGAIDYFQRYPSQQIQVDTINHRIFLFSKRHFSCMELTSDSVVVDTARYILSADTLYYFSRSNRQEAWVFLGDGRSLLGTWQMQPYYCEIPQRFFDTPNDPIWHSFACLHSYPNIRSRSYINKYALFRFQITENTLIDGLYTQDYCFSEWVIEENYQNDIVSGTFGMARWFPRDTNCQMVDVIFPDWTEGVYWQIISSDTVTTRFFEYQGQICQYDILTGKSALSFSCYHSVNDSALHESESWTINDWFQCMLNLGILEKGYIPLL